MSEAEPSFHRLHLAWASARKHSPNSWPVLLPRLFPLNLSHWADMKTTREQ